MKRLLLFKLLNEAEKSGLNIMIVLLRVGKDIIF